MDAYDFLSVFNNPPSGFQFLVIPNYDGKNTNFSTPRFMPNDTMFQEVSGLSCSSSDHVPLEEGGQEFIHQLPSSKYEYSNLVLKRGLIAKSPLSKWVKNSINSQQVSALNIYIALLNDAYFPIYSWTVEKAYPVGWDFSPLNATENGVLVETITLKYEKFVTQERIIEGHIAALAAAGITSNFSDVIADVTSPIDSILDHEVVNISQ